MMSRFNGRYNFKLTTTTMTKSTIIIFVLGLFLLVVLIPNNLDTQNITTPRAPSPAAEVSQTIGISKITVNYSRPSVKERQIWGTPLAHYGYVDQGFGPSKAAPWRAGKKVLVCINKLICVMVYKKLTAR